MPCQCLSLCPLALEGVSVFSLISPKVRNAPSQALSSLYLYSISVAAEYNSACPFPKWEYLNVYFKGAESSLGTKRHYVLGVLDTEAAMEAVTSKTRLIPGSVRSLESTFNVVYMTWQELDHSCRVEHEIGPDSLLGGPWNPKC